MWNRQQMAMATENTSLTTYFRLLCHHKASNTHPLIDKMLILMPLGWQQMRWQLKKDAAATANDASGQPMVRAEQPSVALQSIAE